ncbi:MAG: peptidylprolyl isomerase [Clostridiales Family XIII bacterium]|jgi:foldase protein PrsA|nr:peptidylprolyl isomerase [Clostridiales Family XIII bacterium]
MKTKNMLKKTVAFITGLMLIFSFAACGGKDGKVQAEVGKVKIYENRVNEIANMMAIMTGVELGAYEEAQQKEIKNSMLIFLVETELIRSDLGDKDVLTDDNRKEIEEQLSSIGEDVKKQLKDAGVSDETLRYYLEAYYYSQAFMTKVGEEDPVSDEEIQSYYDEHADEFISPAAVQVSHIMMGSAEHTDADRQAVEAVRARILAGEDFAALAAENSLDTGSKDAGGDLGLLQSGNSYMGQVFLDAALALKNGEISEVVETEYGFHIIKATGDPTAEQQMTLEESEASILGILQNEHAQAAMDKLKKNGKVKYLVDVDPKTGEPSLGVETPEDDGDSDSGE